MSGVDSRGRGLMVMYSDGALNVEIGSERSNDSSKSPLAPAEAAGALARAFGVAYCFIRGTVVWGVGFPRDGLDFNTDPRL